MKSLWINKQNNKNIIVFFCGWSFDNYPFANLDISGYDVLIVYDYNNMSIPEDFKTFEQYESKILITWSMGVFTAYLNKNLFTNFDKKIAVNGTITPVNNEYGIPVKMFELTLKHAAKGLEGKFYQNVFLTDREFRRYEEKPVRRSIENRVSELENLYKLIKNTNIKYEQFYDVALVSEFDKIIPPKNQIASHKKNHVPIITVPYGHYPFYHFTNWDEIVKCQ